MRPAYWFAVIPLIVGSTYGWMRVRARNTVITEINLAYTRSLAKTGDASSLLDRELEKADREYGRLSSFEFQRLGMSVNFGTWTAILKVKRGSKTDVEAVTGSGSFRNVFFPAR